MALVWKLYHRFKMHMGKKYGEGSLKGEVCEIVERRMDLK